MFNIMIMYDDTIYNECVLNAVGIMYTNCVKSIGFSLANQKMKTSSLFLSQIWCSSILIYLGSFSKTKTYTLILKALSFLDNRYNTMPCSRLNGQVFEDYLKTTKRDKYNLMCSIEAHEKPRNKSTRTNLLKIRQVVVVPDHYHQSQKKKH